MKKKFLVSFCNNKELINNLSGNGLLGILLFDGVHLNFKHLTIDSIDLKGINGATGLAKCSKYYYIILQSKVSKLLTLDKEFNTISIQDLGDYKGVHSTVFFKGMLYFVATGQDKIIKYDFKDKYITIYDLLTDSDTLHINSICLHNNEIYASCFGKKKEKFWLSAREGYVFNLNSGEIMIKNLNQPHSLFSYKNLFLCDSSRKRVINQNRKVIIQNEFGYTRGLSISEDIIVYGESKGRLVSSSQNTYIGNLSDKGLLTGQCKITLIYKGISYVYKLHESANEIYDVLQC